MNITIYGDSILKGILLENGRYIINRAWENDFTKRYGVSIKNRSRFGCTIQKALNLIHIDAEHPPQDNSYALVELGGNDCDYDWAAISEDPNGQYECKTPPELFKENYRCAVRWLRESGRTPILTTLPPIHSERYLQFICRDGLSRKNIVSWLGSVNAIYNWQEKYSEIVEKVADEEHVRIIDLRKAFLQSETAPEDLLCLDGIHPSRKGQALIFQTLCNAM